MKISIYDLDRTKTKRIILFIVGVAIIGIAIWQMNKWQISADQVSSARPQITSISEKIYRQGESLTLPIYISDPDESDMNNVDVLVDWGDGSQVMDQSYWHRSVTTRWTGYPSMRILAPHRYSQSGEYTMTITAIDSTGTTSLPVQFPVHVVNDPDTGSHNYAPTIYKVSDADLANVGKEFIYYVDLEDFSDNNGAHSVSIDWGDSSTPSQTTPLDENYRGHLLASLHKIYTTPGVYNTKVTVTDGAGASTSDTFRIIATDTTWAPEIAINNIEPNRTSLNADPRVILTNYDQGEMSGTIDWGDGSKAEDLTSTKNAVATSTDYYGGYFNQQAGVYQFTSTQLTADTSHTYNKAGTYTLTVTATDDLGNNSTHTANVDVGEVEQSDDVLNPSYGTPLKRNETITFTVTPNNLSSTEYAGISLKYPSLKNAGTYQVPNLELLPANEQPAGYDAAKVTVTSGNTIYIPKGMPVSFKTDLTFSGNDGGRSEYKEAQLLIAKGSDLYTDSSGRKYLRNPRTTNTFSYPISDSDQPILTPISGTVIDRTQDNVFTYDSTHSSDFTTFIFRMWSTTLPGFSSGSYQYVPLQLLTADQPDNFDASKVHPITITVHYGPSRNNETVVYTQGFTVEPGTSFKFSANFSPDISSWNDGRTIQDYNRLDVDIYQRAGYAGKLAEMNRYVITGDSNTADNNPTEPENEPEPDQSPTPTDEPTTNEPTNSNSSNKADEVITQATSAIEDQTEQLALDQARNQTNTARLKVIAAQNKLAQVKENGGKEEIKNQQQELNDAKDNYRDAKSELSKVEKASKPSFWTNFKNFFVNIWQTITKFLHR